MFESAALIWLYTFAFALVHSLMATDRLKSYILQQSIAVHHYRLFYSLVSVVSTMLWLIAIAALTDASLYRVEGVWAYILYVLQGLGVLVALAALVPIDGAVFLGLKRSENSQDPFVLSGIYQYIRHPMYAGVMLFLLAKPEMSENSLHFAFAVSMYFVVGAYFEEQRLIAQHPSYKVYKKEIGAFVPKIRKKSGKEI